MVENRNVKLAPPRTKGRRQCEKKKEDCLKYGTRSEIVFLRYLVRPGSTIKKKNKKISEAPGVGLT